MHCVNYQESILKYFCGNYIKNRAIFRYIGYLNIAICKILEDKGDIKRV